MKDLPVGWTWAPFDSVSRIINPRNIPISRCSDHGTVRVIDQGEEETAGYSDAAELAHTGPFPVVAFGDHTRRVKYISEPFIAGAQGLKVIECKQVCEPKFLFYWLHIVDIPDRGYSRHFQFVRKTQIPLPPLAEQRRIVAEIEKQFTRLDYGVSALEAVSERVRVYFQATLNSFTRPTTQRGKGWARRALSQLADIGTGSTPLRSNEEFWRGGTIAWVTSTAVNRPYIGEPQDLVTKVALERTTLKTYPPGTLLIAMYGEGKTRGKVSELRIDATINQALAAIQIRPEWSEYREYTKLALTCAYDQIRRKASGGVQPNLNLGMVSALEVWLPPLSEVTRITSDLSAQLTDAANMLSGVVVALARAARLRQAILKKAFEGKLVPQDPNDEPASVLLERIRATRM